jgi:hypothetical protein
VRCRRQHPGAAPPRALPGAWRCAF